MDNVLKLLGGVLQGVGSEWDNLLNCLGYFFMGFGVREGPCFWAARGEKAWLLAVGAGEEGDGAFDIGADLGAGRVAEHVHGAAFVHFAADDESHEHFGGFGRVIDFQAALSGEGGHHVRSKLAQADGAGFVKLGGEVRVVRGLGGDDAVEAHAFLAGNQLQQRAAEADEGFFRAGRIWSFKKIFRQVAVAATGEYGGEERVFVWVAAVESELGDIGFPGNLFHGGGLHTLLHEEAASGFDYLRVLAWVDRAATGGIRLGECLRNRHRF